MIGKQRRRNLKVLPVFHPDPVVPCSKVLVSRGGTSEEEVHMVLLDLADLLFHLVGVVRDLEGQDLILGVVLVEVSVEALVLNVHNVVDIMLVNVGDPIQSFAIDAINQDIMRIIVRKDEVLVVISR